MKRFRIVLAYIGKRPPGLPLSAPPLGILYLASYIRSFFNADILLIDQKLKDYTNDQVVRLAYDFKADVIGLSAMTPGAHNLSYVTQGIKTMLPESLIVLGGPFVSSYGIEALESTAADAAVPGEGEITFKRIIRAHFDGHDLSGVPGIFIRDQYGRVARNPGVVPIIENLDDLPLPAYDLINLTDYWKAQSVVPIPKRKYASLFSSRGCPYQCIYCHNIFGKQPRFHSADRVIDEIQYMQKQYGVNDFEFIDDIFNINKKRMFEFTKQVKKKNIDIKLMFPNALRTDILTEDEIVALVDAGLVFSSFALETGSPRLQKMIRKNLDIDKFLKNIETAVSHGVFANGFAMMGFPTETEAELQETINVACASRLHTISFFSVTPFPNTRLYEIARQQQPDRIQEVNYKDMEFAGISVNLSEVSDERLFYYQRKANRRFYLSPRRLARIIAGFPQPHLLPLYFPVFIKRLFKQFPLWSSSHGV